MVKDTFPDVEVQRQAVLTGGLLKNSHVLPTKCFATKCPTGAPKTEFVRLKMGEKLFIHAVYGPTSRQCGLRRTKMVEDLITAALAAADGDEAADEAAWQMHIDDAPPSLLHPPRMIPWSISPTATMTLRPKKLATPTRPRRRRRRRRRDSSQTGP